MLGDVKLNSLKGVSPKEFFMVEENPNMFDLRENTFTYLLANPNLEDEIHLKGVSL
jgi:hypothetical protein